MSKQSELNPSVDSRLLTSNEKTKNLKQTPPLHYQIKTMDCVSHTWSKPNLKFIATDHHNGQRFTNLVKAQE